MGQATVAMICATVISVGLVIVLLSPCSPTSRRRARPTCQGCSSSPTLIPQAVPEVPAPTDTPAPLWTQDSGR
jgi:hypothetical protein